MPRYRVVAAARAGATLRHRGNRRWQPRRKSASLQSWLQPSRLKHGFESVRPVKADTSAGVRPAGAKARSPVTRMAGWRETKTLKPIDQALGRRVSESPGRNGSERTGGPERRHSGGRARGFGRRHSVRGTGLGGATAIATLDFQRGRGLRALRSHRPAWHMPAGPRASAVTVPTPNRPRPLESEADRSARGQACPAPPSERRALRYRVTISFLTRTGARTPLCVYPSQRVKMCT